MFAENNKIDTKRMLEQCVREMAVEAAEDARRQAIRFEKLNAEERAKEERARESMRRTLEAFSR